MRKLHIGGQACQEGWEILDAIPREYVDHVGNAADLSQFANNTFDEIYASHVLEHFDYRDGVLAVLQEWHRVLKPEGKLYVSVPDLDLLAALFLDKENFSVDERYQLMRMVFGGHIDEYDYHLVGFNEEFLSSFLIHAGFSELYRVESFGLFDDSSEMLVNGRPISLNVIAGKKC